MLLINERDKRMKLLTKEIEKNIPPIGDTERHENPKIHVKFFTPDANWTWYVLEGEKLESGDWEFFGLVDGHEKKLGYFRLSDLQGAKGMLGLPIERDRYFSGHLKDVQ